MKQTVVLGAGFSLAASDEFPITDELGDRVMEYLKAKEQLVTTSRPYKGGRFEAWLSRLAESQPDLSEAENLRNREMFVRVSNAIRDVLADCQARAIETPPKWWLQKLVGCLHYSKSTAITFNYDSLIELVLEDNWLTDEKHNRARMGDALRHMPLLAERPQTGLRFGNKSGNTFRLIKLHGSIDTYWVNGDSTGATIRRWDSNVRWGRNVPENDGNRKNLLPGREPFIVPPASAKSAFYQNPLTRQLWADAAESIRDADEVAFIGYSLPMTDLVSSGMFGERLNDNQATVVIVNPNPDQPREALIDLGVPDARLSLIGNCAEYVDVLERRFEPTLFYPDFYKEKSEVPVALGVENRPQYPVLKVEPSSENEEILVHVGARDLSAAVASDAPTVADLLDAGSDVKRVRVVFPDGKYAYVANTAVGIGSNGSPESLILHPTAIPYEINLSR